MMGQATKGLAGGGGLYVCIYECVSQGVCMCVCVCGVGWVWGR